jgi:GDP-mannose 6-dehydrogenase
MRISVFGLGYVGAVTAGCLTKRGHAVIGIDVQPSKVEALGAGLSPIVEPGLKELLRTAHGKGLLRATAAADEAVAATACSFVCVGTPSTPAGALDLRFVRDVVGQIGTAVRAKAGPHTLVIRSTMLPGSTSQLVKELLGELVRRGRLEVVYYPEFLREGSAIADFEEPSLGVLGVRQGAEVPAALAPLFHEAPIVTSYATAEMVKYACNAFHATKVVFANEMGRLGKQLGVDAQTVMNALCQDRRLNLSSYYLRPGNPFGGSCLPKDVRALVHHGRVHGLSLPLLENLLPSNERHLQSLLQRIIDCGQSEVVLLGLAFKANTDDLRESAMVEVAQALLGRGYAVRIFDPQLDLGALVGANKRVIDLKMPHLASLLRTDLDAAVGRRGLLVAAQRCVPVDELRRHLTADHQLLDVNGWPELRSLPCRYEGFCW